MTCNYISKKTHTQSSRLNYLTDCFNTRRKIRKKGEPFGVICTATPEAHLDICQKKPIIQKLKPIVKLILKWVVKHKNHGYRP